MITRLLLTGLFLATKLTMDGWAAEPERAVVAIGPDDGRMPQTIAYQIDQWRRRWGDAALRIEFLPGVYRFNETLRLDDTQIGSGLHFVAAKTNAPDAAVMITGSFPLAVNDGVRGTYRYRLPKSIVDLRIPFLQIDDRWVEPAAWPPSGYLRVVAAAEDRRSGFTVDPAELPPDWQCGSEMCDVQLLHDWSSSRMAVQSYDSASATLTTAGPLGAIAKHYAIDHFEPHPRFRLIGHPDFATDPGDWYVDRSAREIVVRSVPKVPPKVQLPVTGTLIEARGGGPLSLEGLTFGETAAPLPPGGFAARQATMHEIRKSDGSRTGEQQSLAAAVQIDAPGARIVRCRFESLGGSGLDLPSPVGKAYVDDCVFEHIGGNAINLGVLAGPVPGGNSVTNCRISVVGRFMPGSVAIWGRLNHDATIEKNHISDCPYTGISLGWKWDDDVTGAGANRIVNNEIRFTMQTLSDGGAVYTLGRQEGSQISDNRLSDIPTAAGRAHSNGIFMDEGSTGFTVFGNTFRRIGQSPTRYHKAGKNVVRDNRWEQPATEVSFAEFNNTPPANVALSDNVVIEREPSPLLDR